MCAQRGEASASSVHDIIANVRAHVRSFPPIASPDAHTLVLGSMPGIASLAAQQYYAHPRNAFWPIMAALFAFDMSAPYEARVAALQREKLAVWDVLQHCERPGSLDAAILRDTEAANDFVTFFAQHPTIDRVFFNGATAEACFARHCPALLARSDLQFKRLPSTSPAHAGLTRAQKIELWRAAFVL
jgi:double-stranded uracil-DNA glycosylase